MNKVRLKQIALSVEKLKEVFENIGNIMNAEEETMDNIPDALRYTPQYERCEEAYDKMSESAEYINDAITTLEEIE